MKCTFKNVPPPENITREEWDKIAKKNSESVDKLMASKDFIAHCINDSKAQGLEEGMPLRWGNEIKPVHILPYRDDDTFEIGCGRTNLE